MENSKLNNYFLDGSDFIYTRLQLINWACQGIFQSKTLHYNTVKEISVVYHNYKVEKCLVVDCKDVDDVGSNALNQFIREKITDRKLILINCEKISGFISAKLNEFKVKYSGENGNLVISKGNIDLPNIVNTKINEVVSLKMNHIVASCFKANEECKLSRLHSTPIYSNGEFDASLIISNPYNFCWICIILADLTNEVISSIRSDENAKMLDYSSEKLISVSYRSCPFAFSVANLIGKELIVIDHLGPKHKLHDLEIIDQLNKDTLIIYIGDFLVGGTEVLIAKAYSNIFDSDLKYAVVIGSAQRDSNNDKCFSDKFDFKSVVLLRDLEVPKCGKVEYSLFNEKQN